jgi:hypothetical protein
VAEEELLDQMVLAEPLALLRIKVLGVVRETTAMVVLAETAIYPEMLLPAPSGVFMVLVVVAAHTPRQWF